jgi:5,10-methylene-tetrahydrofolate dehydrogenase/methenyl tetrahydrofolate cyclohydrolase
MKELLQSDIIVAALGKPEFVTEDMVKEGAVIIDVGITCSDASKKVALHLKVTSILPVLRQSSYNPFQGVLDL